MYKNKRILSVIPARGGSKRLPRKNIKPLHGKPLVAWTIEKAKASSFIDDIFLSTDDPELAQVASTFGCPVPYLRPKELAADNSPTIDTIINILDFYHSNKIHHDYVAILEPTSPLRTDKDIDSAIRILIDHPDATSLVSVGEIHLEKPSITKVITDGFVKPLLNLDGQKAYFPYGVIYLAEAKGLIETGTFYQNKTIPYFIERWQNYEIDDIYDFLCIESIMQHRKDHLI